MNAEYSLIVQNINTRMKALEIETYTELSRITGVTRTVYVNLARNKSTSLSLSNAIATAKGLGCTVEWLATGEGPISESELELMYDKISVDYRELEKNHYKMEQRYNEMHKDNQTIRKASSIIEANNDKLLLKIKKIQESPTYRTDITIPLVTQETLSTICPEQAITNGLTTNAPTVPFNTKSLFAITINRKIGSFYSGTHLIFDYKTKLSSNTIVLARTEKNSPPYIFEYLKFCNKEYLKLLTDDLPKEMSIIEKNEEMEILATFKAAYIG